MLRTRSRSAWIPMPDSGPAAASQIDRAVHEIGADRDVVNVVVAPVAATGAMGSSPTAGFIVTIVWRENPED